MVITEQKIKRICLCCNQEYEDTQIIINGIPSFRSNICPDCLKSGKFAEYMEEKINGTDNNIPDYRSNICLDCLKDDKYMDKIMEELNNGTDK